MLVAAGKTAFFQGQVSDKCIVCPAHNTAFDLATGEVKGEWCPKFPTIPGVYVVFDRADSYLMPSSTARGPHPTHTHMLTNTRAHMLPCAIAVVGKLTEKKPLPTFESRVDAAGNIEVLV